MRFSAAVAVVSAAYLGVATAAVMPANGTGHTASVHHTSVDDSMHLLEAAALPYVRLRADLAHVDETPLNKASVTREAHRRLASHGFKTMAPAHLAYLALVAADTQSFAAAIEKRAGNAKKRTKLLAALRDNPAMVREFDGVDDAIRAMLDASARDATRISKAGERYITDAYRLQETGWARSKLGTNGPARVSEAASFSKNRSWPNVGMVATSVSDAGNRRPNMASMPNWSAQWSTVGGNPQVTLDSRRQVFMTKALVLAARYALDDLNEGHVSAFGKHKDADRCFLMAKLNFDQCIAATRTSYEEAFCVGTHGLNDISRCVGWAADAGSPAG